MKKTIQILAVLVLMLSLCGCTPGVKEPEEKGLSMEELLQKLDDNGTYAEYDTFTMLDFLAEEKQIIEREIDGISNYHEEAVDVLDVHYEGNNVYRMEIAHENLQGDIYLTFSDPEMTGFVMKDAAEQVSTYVLDKGYSLDELLEILEKGNEWLDPNRNLMCSFDKTDRYFNLWLKESSWGAGGMIKDMVHYGVDCYGLWLNAGTVSEEASTEAKLTEVQVKLGHHPENSIRIIMDDPRFDIDAQFYANDGAYLK